MKNYTDEELSKILNDRDMETLEKAKEFQKYLPPKMYKQIYNFTVKMVIKMRKQNNKRKY